MIDLGFVKGSRAAMINVEARERQQAWRLEPTPPTI
jgi:hypothetical protein